jgi:glycosyltransferase involved in cell wall biosynthesis
VRIAVLTQNRRLVGGIETYLATIMPALCNSGHAVALATEADQPSDREPIAGELDWEWCAADLGVDRMMSELCHWRPDVLYAHGALSPALEARFLEVAPAAFFAHGFYGTCISGAKSFKVPVARPCSRRFGWPCLLHYYPHRCGGWNPITMAREYWSQANRLHVLRRYSAIITHSRRMESEYLKHGIPRERVHRVPWCVDEEREMVRWAHACPAQRYQDRPHVVFLGRMVPEKGGHLLLGALPAIREALRKDLRVTFGGDGPERVAWERRAALLRARDSGLEIAFTGWLQPDQRDAILDESDVLVVPSVWPEPFGQVGIEAGRRGVPAAAYAVGGIPEWLRDGFNGFLAPADPPTSQGLAAAVVKCLGDPERLAGLRRGAVEAAGQWSIMAHLANLERILTSIVGRMPRPGRGCDSMSGF